jgi:predicted membrane channel-forming protein YqfA (hemolysin III family)
MFVVARAAFMPWASIFGISKAGIEGDGVITLILAIIGAAVLSFSTGLIGHPRSPGRFSQIVLLALAGLVALVGLIDMSGVAALGLYLTFFGGMAWAVGAIWQLTRGNGSRAPGIG